MKKPILLLAEMFFCFVCFSQFTITGKVLDSETGEPLQGASVFAQNTTRGTTTAKDGSFTIHLDKGGYDLIISFTGFDSRTITITDAQELNVSLKKSDNSMSEVVIRSSNEVPDGWEKYGAFFIRYFIGSTPLADSCIIQNPEVLKFLYYKRNDRLKILAAEPLTITNNALGYQLRYELDSFVYFFKDNLNSYRGRCLYTEMEGTPEQQAKWKEARAKAYYGSRLHFLRAYYDSTLKNEGFTVDVLSKTRADKFDRLTNPYDTTYYLFSDSTGDAELWFPVKASISYTRAAPDSRYLEQFKLPLTVKQQISYIDLTDAILIKPNGYFFDQRSWIGQGYWSWKNLADQLPYDYEPGR